MRLLECFVERALERISLYREIVKLLISEYKSMTRRVKFITLTIFVFISFIILSFTRGLKSECGCQGESFACHDNCFIRFREFFWKPTILMSDRPSFFGDIYLPTRKDLLSEIHWLYQISYWAALSMIISFMIMLISVFLKSIWKK